MKFFSRFARFLGIVAIPVLALITGGLAYTGAHGIILGALALSGVALTVPGVGTAVGVACIVVAALFAINFFAQTASPLDQAFCEWGLRNDRYWAKRKGEPHYLDKAESYITQAEALRNNCDNRILSIEEEANKLKQQQLMAEIDGEQKDQAAKKEFFSSQKQKFSPENDCYKKIQQDLDKVNKLLNNADSILNENKPFNKVIKKYHKECSARIVIVKNKLHDLLTSLQKLKFNNLKILKKIRDQIGEPARAALQLKVGSPFSQPLTVRQSANLINKRNSNLSLDGNDNNDLPQKKWTHAFIN